MISFNRKTLVSLIAGLLFSAVALYFTFVNIPLKDLASYMGRINYWWVIPSALIAVLSFLIRIWRWQIILLPVKRSGYMGAFHPLSIGFMLNCILPGRLGEIARPAVYFKKENVPFSKVLGTVAIERILDGLSLIGFFIYILATIDINPAVRISFAGYDLTAADLNRMWKMTLYASFVLVAAILVLTFPWTRRLINRIIMKMPDAMFFLTAHARESVRERVFLRITHVIDHISAGFDILKSPGYLALCVAQSMVLWWLLGVSLYVLSFGTPGVDLTILEGLAAEIIICFFIMLPSVPGYWGLWEAGGVFGLMLFGIPAKEAAGFTLTFHFLNLVPIIIIGLVSAMILGLNITQTARNGERLRHEEE